MSERAAFRLLWKVLDRRDRWRVRRLAWLGRKADDPETAWLVMMFAGEWVRSPGLYRVVGFGWIALGVVTLVLLRRHHVDDPFRFALGVSQVAVGALQFLMLGMNRRAREVNRGLAAAPGWWRDAQGLREN